MSVDMKFYDCEGNEQNLEQHIAQFPNWTKRCVIDGLVAPEILEKMYSDLHEIASDAADKKITSVGDMAKRLSDMMKNVEPLIAQRVKDLEVGENSVQ